MKTTVLIFALCLIPVFLFSQNINKSGGPGTGGYIWLDSNDPGGPSYSWIDISTTGTEVADIYDDNASDFIPMDFIYYGQEYSQIRVGSNGWVGFDNLGNIAHCFPEVPNSPYFFNFVAPFMTDLNFTGTGNTASIKYYNDIANDRFIVTYFDAPWWTAEGDGYIGSNTFQVIFDRTDYSITYQYQTIDEVNFTDNASCDNDIIIGIQGPEEGIGLLYGQEALPDDGFAVKFSCIAITEQPQSNVNICETDGATFTVSALNADTYQWQVSFDGGTFWMDLSDDETYSGVNTDQLDIITDYTLSANEYRCYITNGDMFAYSDLVSIGFDSENPVIECPENQNVNLEEGQFYYHVEGNIFDPISVSDNCGPVDYANDISGTSTMADLEFEEGTHTITWTATDGIGNYETCSFDIVVSPFTKDKILENDDIIIYPNPVDDYIYLDCLENLFETIIIVDELGRVLYRNQEGNIQQIDISLFNAGVYLLILRNDAGFKTFKFTKL